MLCLLIPYAPTEESTRLAHDVAAAIDAVMPRKAAADLIGVSEADLSQLIATFYDRGYGEADARSLADLPRLLRQAAAEVEGLQRENENLRRTLSTADGVTQWPPRADNVDGDVTNPGRRRKGEAGG